MSSIDLARPHFHCTLSSWLNDVIPLWWNGQYHICFDHNPHAATWTEASSWAHVSSPDLIHWTRLSDAIVPGKPGEPDAYGIWTGCIVRREDGKFAAIYTGIERWKPSPFVQRQLLAVSGDLIHFQKQGIAIKDSPPNNDSDCWRDPMVWRDSDGKWRMIIGGECTDGKTGQILLYESEDASLERWSYLGVLMKGAEETGRMCECPDFFPLGDNWLALSSLDHTWWHLGRRVENKLETSAWGACDSTSHFYAGKTALDGKGRRILFGWIREARDDAALVRAGWAGVLSLPRIITAGPNGKPHFSPPDELLKLRHLKQEQKPSEKRAYPLQLEVESYGSITLLFDGGSKSFTFGPGRVWLDGSVMEHFAEDGSICRTERIYPEEPEALVFSEKDATVWTLAQ